MTDTDNAAQIIERLASAAGVPPEIEPGRVYAYQGNDGVMRALSLQGDEYFERPRRKRGTVTVTDVASFAQHHAKHATEHTEVFADLDQATVTAVLNAHEKDTADWQDHRVTLKLAITPQWRTWTQQDRQMMSQQVFAEFLEDNIGDIAADGPVKAADLLEIAQSFQARTKVNFSTGHRLSSGETQFVYTEETEARAASRGTLSIPPQFELGIAVFEDSGPYRVKARFRYRLNDGTLKLGYHLDDPAGKLRDAIQHVVTSAEEACSVKIMRGRPS